MKNVLVIGAHSYIGQKFKEYILVCKIETISVDMVSASDGSWRYIDFSGYDAILHLSGIVHKKEKKKMESLYYEINHKLTVEIAKKAKLNNVSQFIFMSTAAVYGSFIGCITKETIPNPITLYGKSKLAAEEDIIKLQDDKFKVAIVRPPMIYGEGCKGNYTKIIKVARYLPIFPEFHNKRSILNVDNLSNYIVKIILSNGYGYFFPQNHKCLDICDFIVELRCNLGKTTKLIKGMDPLINFLIKNINICRKIFSDLYYEEELWLNQKYL